MSSTTALRGSAALYGGRLVVAGLSWAGTVVIVRSLRVEQWGQFAFVFSFLGLVSVLTDLGIGRVVIAALAGEELRDAPTRRRYLGTYVVLRTLLGAVGYGIALGTVIVAGYPDEVVRTTAVAGVVLVIATASNALHAVFQSEQRMAPIAIANVLGQLTQLALTIAIATRGGSVVLFALPAVAFDVVSLLSKLAALPASARPIYSIQLDVWRRVAREAAPLAVGAVAVASYTRLDTVMLSKLATFDDVARYGIAYKFADLVHAGSTAISMALLPAVVRAWPDRRAAGEAIRPTFAAIVALGSLAAAQFAVVAPEVVTFFYDERYGASATAARVLVGAECLHLVVVIAYVVVVAAGHPGRYAAAATIGLLSNVALNLLLIPAFSYEGAAVATLATEATVGVLLWRGVRAIDGVDAVGGASRHLATLAIAAASAIASIALAQLLPSLLAAATVTAVAGAILGTGLRRKEVPREPDDKPRR